MTQPDLFRHGTQYCYKVRGCRCTACNGWNRRAQAAYRARQESRFRERLAPDLAPSAVLHDDPRRNHKARQDATGFTSEYYNDVGAAQGWRCAVCGTPRGTVAFSADHDHATGQTRGLLCNTCNTGLGMFRDNPELLARAIGYLEAYRVNDS